MTVYVVAGNDLEVGTFRALRDSTVEYRTENGIKREHIRNVFFKKKNAQYHQMRTVGIFRPIMNGTSEAV